MGKHKLPDYIEETNHVCEYGCGLDAHYQLGNGKWCCSPRYHQCPTMRKVQSRAQKGRDDLVESGKRLGKSNKGRKLSNKQRFKLSLIQKKRSSTDTERQRRREQQLAYHSRLTQEQKEEYSKKRRNNLDSIRKKHPLVCQVEEFRDDPITGKLQARCKNHNCPNSKEKDGWFTLKGRQFELRTQAIENPNGFEENNFYCSKTCRKTCPLFGLQSDPFRNISECYTPGEYLVFTQEVLKRQRDQIGYNECEMCGSREDLHIHHEKPKKTHPEMTLDPDNGIILCGRNANGCHYKYGHVGDCSTGSLASKTC